LFRIATSHFHTTQMTTTPNDGTSSSSSSSSSSSASSVPIPAPAKALSLPIRPDTPLMIDIPVSSPIPSSSPVDRPVLLWSVPKSVDSSKSPIIDPEGTIYCVNCACPIIPSLHQKRVYGEWELEQDYYRGLHGDAYNKFNAASFECTDFVGHTKGCILAHGHDVMNALPPEGRIHYYHMLFRHRYRDLDLPIHRKPGFEVLQEFRAQQTGLTRQQFELLETKYPFIHCVMRKGYDYVERWPGEQNAMLNGDVKFVRSFHLRHMPKPLLKQLIIDKKDANIERVMTRSRQEEKEYQVTTRLKYWCFLTYNQLKFDDVEVDIKWVFQFTNDVYETLIVPQSLVKDCFNWYPINFYNDEMTEECFVEYININKKSPEHRHIYKYIIKAPNKDDNALWQFVRKDDVKIDSKDDTINTPHSSSSSSSSSFNSTSKSSTPITSPGFTPSSTKSTTTNNTQFDLEVFSSHAGNPDDDSIECFDISLSHPDLDSDSDSEPADASSMKVDK
jgi:hypothetical protein